MTDDLLNTLWRYTSARDDLNQIKREYRRAKKTLMYLTGSVLLAVVAIVFCVVIDAGAWTLVPGFWFLGSLCVMLMLGPHEYMRQLRTEAGPVKNKMEYYQERLDQFNG